MSHPQPTIHNLHPRAFTLVETLVAITILTLAILAPFGAAQKVLEAASISRNQIIASALAQEGLEYIRFIRTNNYLANPTTQAFGTQKLGGLNPCTGGPSKKCIVDVTETPGTSAALKACDGSTACPLRITPEGLYTQNTAYPASIFTRKIHIDCGPGPVSCDVDASGEYEIVTVTVTWNDHGSHTLTLVENLYDWY